MYLRSPTIDELKELELSTLADMLVQQTKSYSRLVSENGVNDQSDACLDNILNLQLAIEARRKQDAGESRSKSSPESFPGQ